MTDDDILIGTLMEESWLTLEQLSVACNVETFWLQARLEANLIPQAECVAGVWRFSGAALARARRMRALERDFDAVPELAALVADMEEEIAALRARLACHEP